MTDQNTETLLLPETIHWARRRLTLGWVPINTANVARCWLETPNPEPSLVEVSVVRRRHGVPYRANVTVDGRSLYAYGRTPEEAMEAVDQQWEQAAIRQCPWLAANREAPPPPAPPWAERDAEVGAVKETRFYTTDDCDEEITHTDAGDAIYDYLEKYEPEDWPAELELFAYRKVPVSEAFKRSQALAVFSDLVDALEEQYGDDDFYFDMEALQAAVAALRVPSVPAAVSADPVPSKPIGPPPSPRAVEADRARDAAFAAARAFVEAVVAQYKVGRLEEVKDERATFNTAAWVRENCPEWEKEEDVAAALKRLDAEVAARRYCGCGDELTAEETERCGRCDIEREG